MSYIYENDPTKIGTNLQTAVAYLLSLHKNQYEWNLLGIKVIGTKEALPIPDGDYDYGDAYMIGNEVNGFELWIYTRADEAHAKPYWFNVGAFPKPGSQGPKGEGFEDIAASGIGGSKTQIVRYNTKDGMWFSTSATVQYKDRDDGKIKTATFPIVLRLPFLPGKCLSMDATAGDKELEIKIDETELALDYYKINKTNVTSVPAYSPTKGRIDIPCSFYSIEKSLVQRGINGEANFNWLLFNNWKKSGSSSTIDFDDTVLQLYTGRLVVPKTTSNTGTLTISQLVQLQRLPQLQLQYDGKTYYRMDPMTAPDGTLNYIHIDSVQDGSGGYQATGKCFSITVSTRAWQVVDVSFSGATSSRVYRHHITYNFNISGTNYNAEFDLFSNSVTALTYDEINTRIPLLAPMNVVLVDTGAHKYGTGQLTKMGTALHLYGAVGTVNVDLEPSKLTTVWLDTVVQVG